MRELVCALNLILLLALTAGPAHADYITSETFTIYPRGTDMGPGPGVFHFGVETGPYDNLDGHTDPIAVPLAVGEVNQTSVVDASNPYFTATAAALTNGSNPTVHWFVSWPIEGQPAANFTGGAQPASNFYGTPNGLAGATLSDIKLTVNSYPSLVGPLNLTLTFEGTPGPFVVPPGSFSTPAPTPEPSCFALAALGLSCLVGYARSRHKRPLD